MKVLQINCVYREGSTGKITQDIHENLLLNGEESIVLCGRRGNNQTGVYSIVSEQYAKMNNLCSRVTGIRYGGCILSTEKIKRMIGREKPDIVHLQCINGFFCNIFRLLTFLKKSEIPTVLTLHAEFMYTANCSHAGACDKWKKGCHHCQVNKTKLHSLFFDRTAMSWKRMHEIYKDWNNLHVVACSEWIQSRALQSGEMAKRDIRVIHNGIDNEAVFYPRTHAVKRIQTQYKLPIDKKYILYVSPGFSELKGFDLFEKLVRCCEKMPFHFLLVGGDYDEYYDNMTVIGRVNDCNLLADLYSGADALVVCSRYDTYPTVCLEAISCGTPVVAFDVGGVGETITEGMGGVVPLGNVEAMRDMLLDITHKKPAMEIVQKARYLHAKQRMLEEYEKLYRLLSK